MNLRKRKPPNNATRTTDNTNINTSKHGKVELRKSELCLLLSVVSLISIQFFHLWETEQGQAKYHEWESRLEEVLHGPPAIFGIDRNLSTSIEQGVNESSTPLAQHQTLLPRRNEATGQEEVFDGDWFDMDRWTANPVTNSCFVLENICHSTHEWFYDPNILNTDQDSSLQKRQQYPFTLLLRWRPSPQYAEEVTVPSGYPDYIAVPPPSFSGKTYSQDVPSQSQNRHCQYSPIPNHMTLHSYSNHMLGEFYTRTLVGLFKIVDAVTTMGNNQSRVDGTNNDFATQTQLYVHFEHGGRRGPNGNHLLDSQRLLLGSFTQNPAVSFLELLDATKCRCLKRLFLCGYEKSTITMKGRESSGSSSSLSSSLIIQPGRGVGIEPGDPTKFNRKNNNKYNNNAVLDIQDDKSSSSIMDTNRLRQHVRKHFIENHPLLMAKIRDHRYQLLHKERKLIGIVDEHDKKFDIDQEVSQWKIIGLAQRTGRRRWQNLGQLVNLCNIKFKARKFLCVEVNIEDEEWSNPVKHVVAYGGLDVLMGIHGAQLTEAVFMKPESLVVEFLPWIPPTINWGRWTRWGHRPTPLGVVFSETDLNHIGYPLRRDSSVDTCQKGKVDRECFEFQEANRWDNRDFSVPIRVFQDIIIGFVAKKPDLCQDYVTNAKDDFILYNVYCTPKAPNKKVAKDDTSPTTKAVQHYYRAKNWVDKQQQIMTSPS